MSKDFNPSKPVDDLLNRKICTTLTEAKISTKAWRREYNQLRPHNALHYRPPTSEVIIPVIIPMGLTLDAV